MSLHVVAALPSSIHGVCVCCHVLCLNVVRAYIFKAQQLVALLHLFHTSLFGSSLFFGGSTVGGRVCWHCCCQDLCSKERLDCHFIFPATPFFVSLRHSHHSNTDSLSPLPSTPPFSQDGGAALPYAVPPGDLFESEALWDPGAKLRGSTSAPAAAAVKTVGAVAADFDNFVQLGADPTVSKVFPHTNVSRVVFNIHSCLRAFTHVCMAVYVTLAVFFAVLFYGSDVCVSHSSPLPHSHFPRLHNPPLPSPLLPINAHGMLLVLE